MNCMNILFKYQISSPPKERGNESNRRGHLFLSELVAQKYEWRKNERKSDEQKEEEGRMEGKKGEERDRECGIGQVVIIEKVSSTQAQEIKKKGQH